MGIARAKSTHLLQTTLPRAGLHSLEECPVDCDIDLPMAPWQLLWPNLPVWALILAIFAAISIFSVRSSI